MIVVGLAEEFAAAIPDPIEILTGSIAEVTLGGTVAVFVGGSRLPDKLICAVGYKPVIGDPVLVVRQGQYVRVLGPVTVALPDTGVVAASPGLTASTVTVTVAGIGAREMPWVGSTPAVADTVAILWRGGDTTGLVLGEVGTAYAPPSPEPPPTGLPPGATTGSTVFTATACGSYRDGAWRTDDNGDVIQGTYPGFGANQGVWFYSGQPRATLGGATVDSAEIWLSRAAAGVNGPQTVHLYRTGEDYKGSPPTFGAGPTNHDLSVGQYGWFPISTTIAQGIVDAGGGVGIQGAPYLRMAGLTKSGQAGALRINWRR